MKIETWAFVEPDGHMHIRTAWFKTEMSVWRHCKLVKTREDVERLKKAGYKVVKVTINGGIDDIK